MIEGNNSFLYSYPKVPASIVENNYNLELGFKSLSLADTKNMLETVRNSKDTAVKRIFDQWMAVKKIAVIFIRMYCFYLLDPRFNTSILKSNSS